MNVIFVTLIILTIIIFVSNSFGNFLKRRILRNEVLISEFLGLSTWIGILFIFGYFLLLKSVSTSTFYFFFLLISLIIILISFKYFKWEYTFKTTIFIFFNVSLLILFSLKFSLGEQLGDNIYLTNLVSMNTIRDNLNSVLFENGLYIGINSLGAHKAYLTWYHFFGFFSYYIELFLNVYDFSYIPIAIIYIWSGNILFYFMSTILILNFIKRLKIQKYLIIFILFTLFYYWNTVYYNLVLPHFGSNFISIFVINLWLLLISNTKIDYKFLLVIVMNIYSVTSTGVVGFVSVSFIVFSYVMYSFINNDTNTFKILGVLLIPIFHWLIILNSLFKWDIIYYFIVFTIIILWIILNTKNFRALVLRKRKIIFVSFLVIWYFINLFYIRNDLTSSLYSFFEPKSNFDRVQDFFSFTSVFDILRNFVYYLAIIGFFTDDETKIIGKYILIIIVFFINPLTYKLIFDFIAWEYNRSYIIIFNIFFIYLGIFAFLKNIANTIIKEKILLVLIVSFLIPSIYTQINDYFSPIYKPSDDFNVIYKLDNKAIEILDKLHQIIKIEKYDNARVISQIYGTQLYEPSVYHVLFNFNNRRGYDPNSDDTLLDPLYRIFYTPAFQGDDGPRFSAPLDQTCSLLIDSKIDFIIYDKSLSVYDSKVNAWIPTYWYARDCAENVLDNDKFILYRFYWK